VSGSWKEGGEKEKSQLARLVRVGMGYFEGGEKFLVVRAKKLLWRPTWGFTGLL